MPKAISYTRFSSVNQGKGSTIERQSQYISQWLKDNPEYKLSDLSASDQGRSGFSGEHLNHGLGKILHEISTHNISSGDIILVEAIDRIGRLPPMEMLSLIQSIIETGVKIITLEDNTEYSSQKLNQDNSSLYILVGKIQQAHDYSKRLSYRISAAYDRKRLNAKEGQSISLRTPIWLTSKGDLIPEYADMVKDCIDLYLKGYSANLILKNLRSKHPRLDKTHPETLKKWFKNRAIIGEWENKGDNINGVFTPLIDKETFYKLQREMTRRFKEMSPPTQYNLSGLVICSQCSSKFYFRTKKHRNYTIIYANCSKYLKFGKTGCSNNKTWPYEVLKFIADKTTSGALLPTAIERISAPLTGQLEALQSEIKEEEKRLSALLELSSTLLKDQNIKDQITRTSLKIASLSQDSNKLENSLSQTSNKAYDSEDLLELYDDINSDPRLKQKVLLTTDYRILIDNDTAKITDYTQHEQMAFQLIKRSTKHNCYFLMVQHIRDQMSEDILNYSLMSQGLIDQPMQNISMDYLAAIDRNGLKATSRGTDINDLLRALGEPH